MNFGTFIGLVFLVVLWHVAELVKDVFISAFNDDRYETAKHYQNMMKEEYEKLKTEVDSRLNEKRTIGFQSTEVTSLNDKEEP